MLCVGASCEPLLCVGGPVPLEARQGRTRQRFGEGGERLLAGCIPVRFRNGMEGAEAVEIMLISRKGGKGWALPKGGWETDEPVEAAAARETLEEAGVRGTLDLPMLGCFSFTSAKEHQSCYQAHIFVMRVVEVLECWPERDQRQRHWFSIQEALQRCSHAWMRAALMQCILHNGWDEALPDVCKPRSIAG